MLAEIPYVLEDSDAQVQLRMEADVRRLLRRAGDPLQLAALPLARELCVATGIQDVDAALHFVIERAFYRDWQEARLRDLLLPVDREGPEPTAESAARLQVSKRHWHRRRAKAVAILARYIRTLIGVSRLARVEGPANDSADPLDNIAELISDMEPATAADILRLGGPQSAAKAKMLAIRSCLDLGTPIEEAVAQSERSGFSPLLAILRAQTSVLNGNRAAAELELRPLFTRAARDVTFDSEALFELEWLAFLRARHGGDTLQMKRVATNLGRLARDRATWISRALLAQAESQIQSGRLQDALVYLEDVDQRSHRDFSLRRLASSVALKAEIALQQGDDPAAERLAAGAFMILRGRHRDAYRCQVTIARARLRLGKPWSVPADVDNLPAESWDRMALEIEGARHVRAAGYSEEARELAAVSFRNATGLEYAGLAARAAATVGATFAQSSTERRDWYFQALSQLLATRHRLIGCDLFIAEDRQPDVAPFAFSDEAVAGLLYRVLENTIPQLRARCDAEARAARAFLNEVNRYVSGPTLFVTQLDATIDALNSSGGSFGAYLLHFLGDAAELLELAFAATVSLRQRAEVEQRLSTVWRALASAIRHRDGLGRFLIG